MSLELTDAEVPLHLLEPEYGFSYGKLEEKDVDELGNRVFNFIKSSLYCRFADDNGKEVPFESCTKVESGAFRLDCYEAGLLYAALLQGAQSLKRDDFAEFTLDILKKMYSAVEFFHNKKSSIFKGLIEPECLDDCGTLAWAFNLAHRLDAGFNPAVVLKRASDFIINEEVRLKNGMLARHRPFKNTLWLDDLAMSIPFLCAYGKDFGMEYLIKDSIKQFLFYKNRMLDEKSGFYRHGHLDNSSFQPGICWARSNGWVLLSLCVLLEYVPVINDDYASLVSEYRRFAANLVKHQSIDGLWHQILDRNDTYTESSAAAIFVAGLCFGVNRGLLEAKAFAPAVIAAFESLCSRIDSEGKINGTCVGTGLGFDPVFYAKRPQSPYAFHAYGPFFMAYVQIKELLKRFYQVTNDKAIHCYESFQDSSQVTFSEKTD